MYEKLYRNGSLETWMRLILLWFAMAVGAVVVIARYRWAQSQNGGPPPRLEMEILIAATPALASIVGWLGRNLRVWSWSFAVAGAFGAYYTVARVLEDEGGSWTRMFYQDAVLRVHLPLALFGVAALANVLTRPWFGGPPPDRNRLKVGACLVPLWLFFALAAL